MVIIVDPPLRSLSIPTPIWYRSANHHPMLWEICLNPHSLELMSIDMHYCCLCAKELRGNNANQIMNPLGPTTAIFILQRWAGLNWITAVSSITQEIISTMASGCLLPQKNKCSYACNLKARIQFARWTALQFNSPINVSDMGIDIMDGEL